MADTENKKQLKRKPEDDNIDPKTGLPLSEEGIGYPPELEFLESMLSGPIGAGKAILKNAAGKVGAAAARSLRSKAIEKMKAMLPSKEAVAKEAVSRPELIEAGPERAREMVGREQLQSKQNYEKLQTAKQYGGEPKPGAPMNYKDINAVQQKPEGPSLDYSEMNAIKRKPENPGLDYSEMRTKGIVKKLKKPGEE